MQEILTKNLKKEGLFYIYQVWYDDKIGSGIVELYTLRHRILIDSDTLVMYHEVTNIYCSMGGVGQYVVRSSNYSCEPLLNPDGSPRTAH